MKFPNASTISFKLIDILNCQNLSIIVLAKNKIMNKPVIILRQAVHKKAGCSEIYNYPKKKSAGSKLTAGNPKKMRCSKLLFAKIYSLLCLQTENWSKILAVR